MRLCLLLLIALASAASIHAETGGMRLECPGTEWALYSDRYEASCMKLMPQPKLFDEAFKACYEMKSQLLSLQHKQAKILFVNNLIMTASGESQSPSLWFFDSLGIHVELGKPPHSPEARWLVISPSKDPAKIELLVNMTAVPRSFLCEAPARPAAQRPQLEREPEDAFLAADRMPFAEPEAKDATPGSKQSPIVVTFDCQAFGIPRPTISWVLVSNEIQKQLSLETINATVIHSSHLPVAQPAVDLQSLLFFNLQRDCKLAGCPPDRVQERSQLIVVNPQLLLTGGRRIGIACVATNDFGSVLSREAQLIETRLGQFANQSVKVSAVTGSTELVKNSIAVQPDAASIECFRVFDEGKGRVGLMPIEEVNRVTRGGLQLSRATFDFIVDAAAPGDAGRYLCQVSLPNGRLGRITRERTLLLDVQPCPTAACNLMSKPVSIVPGYPAVHSMNPFSSRIVRHGDSFLVECPCTGKRHQAEDLLVEWNLNNRSDLAVMILPALPQGAAILLPDADAQRHAGLYKCRCHRGAEATSWHSVQVDVLPSLTPYKWHQELVKVHLGDTVTLNCRVDSVKDIVAVSVEPLKGTQPVTSSERWTLTRPSPDQFSLSISNITAADAGVFGCRVTAKFTAGWLDVNTYYTALTVESAA